MTAQDESTHSKFWTVNIGQIVTMILFCLGLIWTTAVFATKSTNDIDGSKSAAEALKTRIEVVDAKTAAMDARMVAVETGIMYIRESLTRIERAVAVPEPNK